MEGYSQRITSGLVSKSETAGRVSFLGGVFRQLMICYAHVIKTQAHSWLRVYSIFFLELPNCANCMKMQTSKVKNFVWPFFP